MNKNDMALAMFFFGLCLMVTMVVVCIGLMMARYLSCLLETALPILRIL